jgi:histidine ammonia-lyase
MSVEALLGTDRVLLAEDLQALRPHPGQAASAANMRRLLAGSGIVASHRSDDPRVQDAYSLRCAPQVAGAVRDTIAHARAVAERELASAIDNPVVLEDGRVESNGNFHGAPVGLRARLPRDRRRRSRLDERAPHRPDARPSRSNGLPPFLAETPASIRAHDRAVHAGRIVSEMKRLAAPASVDSIPSSAMQEDHVSMGWNAARKLRRSVEGLSACSPSRR